MFPLTHVPTTPLAERFANSLPPRLGEAPLFLLEAPAAPILSSRLAQAMNIYPLLTWSAAFPLVLWAGQEESNKDIGGTFVFIACCLLTIGIFSKTGWKNEEPK